MPLLAFSGAEAGDFSEWASTVGSPTLDTSIVRHGAYAIALASAATQANVVLTTALSETVLYARMHFYVTVAAAPSVDNLASGRLLEFYEPMSTSVFVRPLWRTAGGLNLQLFYNGGGGNVAIGASIAVTLGSWHLLELSAAKSGSVGWAEMKLDGVIVANSFNLNTGAAALTGVDVLGPDTSNGLNATVRIDNLAVSNISYLGDGEVALVKGRSGTPTYAAWTLTGGAIDVVWGAAPASATANAASSAASQAQTMLAGDPRIPLNLSGGIRLNGCQVVAAAKGVGGAGDGTYSLRQRLNGVDTDKAVTLTGADLIRKSDVFLPAWESMAGLEIGAVRGTGGTINMQVEDCWLMADLGTRTGVRFRYANFPKTRLRRKP